ncbi:MAG TPA: hypothetical protein VEA69_17010 [Tepidisphaeraceae bacterium]|nr:hypothetical protein [Tepidisphaeraceae bacterium]
MSMLTRVLLTACLATPAIAQPANPLEQSAPPDPLKNDGRGAPAVVGAVTGAAGVPIDAPAFIKPGARLIYTHLSSMDKPFNLFTPWEKFGPQTVDGSIMASDVVAVLPGRILVSADGYAINQHKEHVAMGGYCAALVAKQVDDHQVAWFPTKRLAELQSAGGIHISRGPFPLKGKTYQATIIAFQARDNTTMKFYDSGTGLLLASSVGAGHMRWDPVDNGGLNRQVQRSSTFETYRVLDLPWTKANATSPEWAARVKRLSYRGIQRIGLAPDGAGVALGRTVTVTERGDGWAIASVGETVQGQPAGPAEALHVQGPASIGAYWMNPAALRDLKEGQIDKDPLLGVTLRYDVRQTPAGKLGVLSQTSRQGGQIREYGYSVDDGALRVINDVRRDLGYVRQFELAGRE